MRKVYKKLMALAMAGVMATSLFAAFGCTNKRDALGGDYTSGQVESNGGFVAKKGNYYYFINGKDDYTADNTFGKVVKASLCRIAVSDFAAGDTDKAEIVVPSLIVTADYTSGFYIYGDTVYYATPTTAKNTSGSVENTYLDFKSTSLDGSKTSDPYFRTSDRAEAYRFVEENGTVYVIRTENSNIYSFNLSTKEENVIVKGYQDIVWNSSDKADGRVYYTMGVQTNYGKENSYTFSYNQIYTITPSAEVDKEDGARYITDDEGKEVYVNYGDLVLDGIGSKTPVVCDQNFDGNEGAVEAEYKYTLKSNTNDGVYYVRDYVNATSSEGDGGSLYYLSESNVTSDDWNAVKGNYKATEGDTDGHVRIAKDTTNASESALFYKLGDKHGYIYSSDSNLYNMVVGSSKPIRIAEDASSAVPFMYNTVGEYNYVYYYMSGTDGNKVYRGVFTTDGSDNYNTILGKSEYIAQQILDIEFDSDWYLPEIIDGTFFYLNANTVNGNDFAYIKTVSLKKGNAAMTNADIKAFNEDYAEQTTRSEYITDFINEKLGTEGFSTTAAKACQYVFYMGEMDAVNTAIADAVALGKAEDYLYNAKEVEVIKAYMERTDAKTIDDYINVLGIVTEDDATMYAEQMVTLYVTTYSEEEEEETGLPAWAIVLIVVGSVLVAAGIACAITIPLVIRNKKKKQAEGEEKKVRRVKVDVTDDKSVDVYGTDEQTEKSEETSEVVEEVVSPETAENEEEVKIDESVETSKNEEDKQE